MWTFNLTVYTNLNNWLLHIIWTHIRTINQKKKKKTWYWFTVYTHIPICIRININYTKYTEDWAVTERKLKGQINYKMSVIYVSIYYHILHKLYYVLPFNISKLMIESSHKQSCHKINREIDIHFFNTNANNLFTRKNHNGRNKYFILTPIWVVNDCANILLEAGYAIASSNVNLLVKLKDIFYSTENR